MFPDCGLCSSSSCLVVHSISSAVTAMCGMDNSSSTSSLSSASTSILFSTGNVILVQLPALDSSALAAVLVVVGELR